MAKPIFTTDHYVRMKTVLLNKEILDSLNRCGFQYCYSKTVTDEQASQVSIFLTPVWFKPSILKLPLQFDTYFHMAEEPKCMAMGIDEDTAVFINLDDTILKECYE